MIIWSEVDNSVLNIAREIINLHHEELEDARIGFVFRSETGKSGGKLVVAKAAKVPAKYQPIGLELDFMIWIAEDYWATLTTPERQALIDHELCHCAREDGEYKLRGHDVEEFDVIIQRWGLWNFSLVGSAKAFHNALQLSLGLKTPPKGEVVSVQPEFMQLPVKEE